MSVLKRSFVVLFFIMLKLNAIGANPIPKSIDLLEEGKSQRRDLSIIGSRIVINPYHFDVPAQEITPADYSNKPTLPLNVGYMSTKNAFTGDRFGREVKELLLFMEKTPSGNKEASSYKTMWSPHALFFSGSYENDLQINGKDFFYDGNTLIRTISFNKKADFVIAGQIPGKLSVQKGSIIIEHPNFNYSIQINKKFGKINYYRNEEDLKLRSNPLATQEGATYWAVDINKEKDITMSISFALKNVDFNTLISNASIPLKGNNVSKAFNSTEEEWNKYLANLPHPKDFKIHTIDNKGVTAEEIRSTYYKAWIFLAQSVLVPDPEYYPFYQIVAGKPSLWDHAHANAPFSAAWESFVAMQLYGYIDPEVAWSSLKGMLSLVDDTGLLGGESLPSKKAETAWVLYQLSDDKSSLQEVYPALTRYLDWRISQPRWIYKDLTPENEKDAEFVVEALTDIKYMSGIATALGLKEDAANWKKKYNELYKNYLNWFWKTPQTLPVQHINQFKDRETHEIQITTGLFVEELSGDYYDSMLGLFYKYYDPDKPFAGFTAAKYPDVSYTVYGLIEKNKTELACGLLEANIRDIVLSNVFAETYLIKEKVGVPAGVRPSIFGMASIIDFILLKNNYFYGRGIPSVVNLFDEASGVDNIKIKNKILSVSHPIKSDKIHISGTFIQGDKSISVAKEKITPLQ